MLQENLTVIDIQNIDLSLEYCGTTTENYHRFILLKPVFDVASNDYLMRYCNDGLSAHGAILVDTCING